jgi:hypothetical protein
MLLSYKPACGANRGRPAHNYGRPLKTRSFRAKKRLFVANEQGAIIADLKYNFALQQEQIEALTADLQKVSARLEVSKAAPRTVLNNR